MTSLDFLYIALGGGFLVLVIFISVVLVLTALILRDVSKTMDNVKMLTDRIRETVYEPIRVLSETFASVNFITEVVDKLKEKEKQASNPSAEEEDEEESDYSDDDEYKEGNGGFKIKKVK